MWNGISILVSINGIIKAEIAFHSPADRINQIIFYYVGSQYQFNTAWDESARESHLTWSQPLSILLPYCDAHRYLDMLDNAFLFLAASPPGGCSSNSSLWWQRSHESVVIQPLSTGQNKRKSPPALTFDKHQRSPHLNCQEMSTSQKVGRFRKLYIDVAQSLPAAC